MQEDEEYASIAELRDKMQRLMETQDSTQRMEENEAQSQLMQFQDQLSRLTHDREARYTAQIHFCMLKTVLCILLN